MQALNEGEFSEALEGRGRTVIEAREQVTWGLQGGGLQLGPALLGSVNANREDSEGGIAHRFVAPLLMQGLWGGRNPGRTCCFHAHGTVQGAPFGKSHARFWRGINSRQMTRH